LFVHDFGEAATQLATPSTNPIIIFQIGKVLANFSRTKTSLRRTPSLFEILSDDFTSAKLAHDGCGCPTMASAGTLWFPEASRHSKNIVPTPIPPNLCVFPLAGTRDTRALISMLEAHPEARFLATPRFQDTACGHRGSCRGVVRVTTALKSAQRISFQMTQMLQEIGRTVNSRTIR